jgi:cytochrome c oxidase subunit 1
LLVIVPLFLGLATYIVPLQVGASTVAFPRAAAAAMWTWLLSSGVFVVASFIEGGFGGERAKSVSLTLLALGGLIVALLLGTVSVLTTAITLRTPGMTLDRWRHLDAHASGAVRQHSSHLGRPPLRRRHGLR